MKNFYIVASAALLFSCASQPGVYSGKNLSCPMVSKNQAPQLLWTLEGLDAPESVVYDPASKALYVSNIVGAPTDKDQKAWISKVSLQGKMLEKKWSQGKRGLDAVDSAGLSAPKGMRIKAGLLWVADIDRVVALQISSARKAVVIKIPGAKFLNDVEFGAGGDEIFVSDMLDDKIYSVDKAPKDWVWSQGPELEGPNGLFSTGKELLVASWGSGIQSDFSTKVAGHVLSVDAATKKITSWTRAPIGHLDGIEADGDNAVLISDWSAGKVMRLTRNGKCHTLVEGFKGSADIHFVPEGRILLVPVMNENKLQAYKLPEL